MRHDSSSIAADEHVPLVNPRALTTLATAVGLIYTLHQPVRWVLRVAADVDALTARVSVLEGELARRDNERSAEHATDARPTPASCPRFRSSARPLSCP